MSTLSSIIDEPILLSSIHGRDRRQTRNIGKRDLEEVVKHGVRQKSHKDPKTGLHRWKYTFANIVFITDHSSTKEVTSWVLPLDIHPVPVTGTDECNHDLLKEGLLNSPEMCTSHTVLVVDASGSMRTCDVENYKTRSDAVYGTLALDLLGKQLDALQVSGTDVVSLIEMHEESHLIFDREPLTNVLYNRLLKRKHAVKPSYGGNFLPALRMAQDILSTGPGKYSRSCALLLLFLSDGRPSDKKLGGNRDKTIEDLTGQIAGTFRERLQMETIAFANTQQCDVSLLQRMADAATANGSKGSFNSTGLCATTLSSVVSRLSSNLSMTRSQMTARDDGGPSRRGPARVVEREAQHASSSSSYRREQGHLVSRNPFLPAYSCCSNVCEDTGWRVYTENVSRAVWTPLSSSGEPGQRRNRVQSRGKSEWVYEPLLSPAACGVAIRARSIGEGCERIVFQMKEIAPCPASCDLSHVDGRFALVGPDMVGKESRYVEEEQAKLRFHKTFCDTQQWSQTYAEMFNRQVDLTFSLQGGAAGAQTIAHVTFLEPSVYVFTDPASNYERGVLAEKRLDVSRYAKWNSNNGFVLGAAPPPRDHVHVSALLESLSQCRTERRQPAALIGLSQPQQQQQGHLAPVAEGDSSEEEEEDDSDDDDAYAQGVRQSPAAGKTAAAAAVSGGGGGGEEGEEGGEGGEGEGGGGAAAGARAPALTTNAAAVKLEDFPQAFSHFSYRKSSRRKLLVCDLQGVLDESASPSLFELTDPVIHHISRSSERKKRFGRTDHGRTGVSKFFKTHKCNAVCRMLGLPPDTGEEDPSSSPKGTNNPKRKQRR